jgi:hypothetical protein
MRKPWTMTWAVLAVMMGFSAGVQLGAGNDALAVMFLVNAVIDLVLLRQSWDRQLRHVREDAREIATH